MATSGYTATTEIPATSFLEEAVQATLWQERIPTARLVSLLVAASMWRVITRFINSMFQQERQRQRLLHRQDLQPLRRPLRLRPLQLQLQSQLPQQ